MTISNERSKMDSDIENLISNDSAQKVKPCRYPSCKNTIPLSSESDFCEVCRVVAIRNAITLCVDPTTPMPERYENVIHTAAHNMTVDELRNCFNKITDTYGRLFPLAMLLLPVDKLQESVQLVEKAYLDFCKTIKANELQLPSTKRKWEDLKRETIEARSTQTGKKKSAGKKTSGKQTKLEKARKLLGDDAEAILGEDFSDF